MIANELLLWMSARGAGSWVQYRAAVERLSRGVEHAEESTEDVDSDPAQLPFYQRLRLNLERLGFAEFSGAAGDREWRVTPPVIAVVRRGGLQRGFLIGARSDNLIRLIQSSPFSGAIGTQPHEDRPDSIVIEIDDSSVITKAASSAGLIVQFDAPTAILAVLDELTFRGASAPVELPLGTEWRFQRFRERELRWEDSSRSDMESTSFGMFRLRFHYKVQTLLRWSGRTYHSELAKGKYLCLKRVRKGVVTYEQESEIFALPAICRPPILIERALALCSGQLPSVQFRGRIPYVHYRDVPVMIARRAASLLRQRLP